MGPNEFNSIEDINQRAKLLWNKGEFVEDRIIYSKYQIKIYSLFSFYVEVWVNLKDNHIEKVLALESETDWTGFLQSVRLSYLLD